MTAPDPDVATARGLAVFDLPPGGRAPTPGWQRRCAFVHRDWRAGDNVGVGCRASGVVGIDLDRHDRCVDGVARFAALCARRGREWPATLAVRTPRAGLHLYFRAPVDRTILSASGARSVLGPGIDIRGPGRRTGGYLVGPDSVVNGRRYVVTHDVEMLELPGWLVDLLAS